MGAASGGAQGKSDTAAPAGWPEQREQGRAAKPARQIGNFRVGNLRAQEAKGDVTKRIIQVQ